MFDPSNWTAPEKGSGRVLFPLTPFPGESLIGLVARVAQYNVHTSTGSIMTTAGYPHIYCHDLAYNNLDKLPRLANTLALDIEDVQALSYRPLEVDRGPPAIDFFDARVVKYDFVVKERRFSPSTIATEPFYRAIWQHRLLPYCPISLELLLSRCSDCESRLNWYLACPVGFCPACGGRVAANKNDRIKAEFADGYRRMASLLEPNSHSIPDTGYAHEDLRSLGRGEIFELGWALGWALSDIPDSPRLRHSQLTATQIAKGMALGDKILRNWPEGVEQALWRRLEQVPQSQRPAVLDRLQRLRRPERSWQDVALLLRTTVPHLFGSIRAIRRNLAEVQNSEQATRAMQVSAASLAKLKRAGKVSTITKSGHKRGFCDFDPAEVDRLAAVFTGRLATESVAERTGMTAHGAEQLICLGILGWQNDEALLHLWERNFTTKASFQEFITQLQERVSPCEDDRPWQRLKQALKIVGGREKPFGPLVENMLKGQIEYRIVSGSARLLDRVMVPVEATPLIAALSFERSDYPEFPFQKTLPLRDAESLFNVGPSKIRAAVGAPAKEGPALEIAEMIKLAQRYISPGEISARWLAAIGEMPAHYLRKAGLPAASAAGWPREEIEHLFANHQMTAERRCRITLTGLGCDTSGGRPGRDRRNHLFGFSESDRLRVRDLISKSVRDVDLADTAPEEIAKSKTARSETCSK